MRGDKIPPRLQGDIGELSAMVWLAWHGAKVYVPVGTARTSTSSLTSVTGWWRYR
jgi:hypothetical protein